MRILLVLLTAAGLAYPTSYLTIKEQHVDTSDIEQHGKGIVDVNATLNFSIDTGRIRLLAVYKGMPAGDIAAAGALLQRQGAILKLLDDISGSREDRRKRLHEISIQFDRLFTFAQNVPALRSSVERILEQSGDGSEYETIGAAMGEYIAAAGCEINAENNRIYLRLGGWLQDKSGAERPVHIQGFDTYAAGEFYEVPFFIVPAPDEIKKQLLETKKICEENTAAFGMQLENICGNVDSLGAAALMTVGCIDRAIPAIASMPSGASPTALAAVKTRCAFLHRNLSTLGTSLRRGAENPLTHGPAALSDAVQTFLVVKDTLSAVFSCVNTLVNVRTGVAALPDSLKAAIAACTTGTGSFIADLDTCRKTVEMWLALSSNGKMREITAAFGEQVRSLLLEQATASLDFDLRSLGVRNPGDRLVLRLTGAQGKAGKGDAGASAVLFSEQRSMTLARVAWYGRLTIGPAFVAPIGQNRSKVKLATDFQPCVSYSLLIKKGSRRLHEPCASFLLPGFGVNVTAPDFNLDGVPEFGVGPVVSWVNDILQCGAGRNIGADAWYGFFVLRLPFSIISAPGSEISVRE